MKRADKTCERRVTIIEAAERCFARSGFHQTSMRDISRDADVSLGNLYNHFESKDELITAIADREADDLTEVRDFLENEDHPVGAITEFAAAFLAEVSAPQEAALMVEIAAEAARNPDVAKIFQKNRTALTAMIEDTLRRGAAEGHVDPGLDPNEAAELVVDLIEGTASRSVLTGKGASPQTQTALCGLLNKYLRPSDPIPAAEGSDGRR